jgi:hypothetical protein
MYRLSEFKEWVFVAGSAVVGSRDGWMFLWNALGYLGLCRKLC